MKDIGLASREDGQAKPEIHLCGWREEEAAGLYALTICEQYLKDRSTNFVQIENLGYDARTSHSICF